MREENEKLKRLVADLSLDRHIPQKIVGEKSCEASGAPRACRVDAAGPPVEPAGSVKALKVLMVGEAVFATATGG